MQLFYLPIGLPLPQLSPAAAPFDKHGRIDFICNHIIFKDHYVLSEDTFLVQCKIGEWSS